MNQIDLYIQFLDDAGHAGIAVEGPKDIADVYAYTHVVAVYAHHVVCQ